MDQILLVLFLKPVDIFLLLVFWLKLVDSFHLGKLLAILKNCFFMFRHGRWIYADGQGLTSVPCFVSLIIRRVSFYLFFLHHWTSIASFQQAHGTWNKWHYLSPRTSGTQWGRHHCWSIIVIARHDGEDQTMTNRGIIMVSEAIECEAVAQCIWHVFVMRFMMINYY